MTSLELSNLLTTCRRLLPITTYMRATCFRAKKMGSASLTQSTGHPSGQGSVGVDGGSLAGAGVTWVQSEANEIEEYESQIFAVYIEGLRDSG